ETHPAPRKGHQFPDKIGMYSAIFSQKDVGLLQFVLDLAGVATGQQYEQIQRGVIKLQFSLFRATPNDFGGFLFPAAPAGIEPIKNLDLRPFGQRLVKRSTFINLSGADQECDARSWAVFE